LSTWQIVPGTTVRFVYRWGAAPLIYVPVTVSSLTPLQFTATAHGIPDGWSVAIADLASIPQLIAKSWPPTSCDYRQVRVVDANTIEFNTIDAARINGAMAATGKVAYETPTNLASMTGTFTVDGFVTPFTPVFDNTAKTITITISALQSATLTAGQSLSFELLVVDSGLAVTQLDFGQIEVIDGPDS
jgi:hypothetical protein